MARFTYIPWYDADGNFIGTNLQETQGYFANLTPEQLAAVAEGFHTNYTYSNLSQAFGDVYFNYSLRRKLHEVYPDSVHLDTAESGDSVRDTADGHTERDSCGQSEDTDESATRC